MPSNERIKIRFVNQYKDSNDFYNVLKERVESYFQANKISRHANYKAYLKAIFLISALIVLYSAIITEAFNKPILLILAIALGVTEGMIGVNISHDALHGAFSSNPNVNRAFGYTFDFVGLSSLVWKITHNYNHHIYTNIPGADHDIDKAILLRLSPKDKLYRFHYFQNWYIFFLYSLTGLNWIFSSDYKYFFKELKKHKLPLSEIIAFFFFKAINNLVFLIIPLIVMTFPWWQILFGYLVMQMAGGFVVALIFQLAHLVEQASFPKPDENGVIYNQWAVHELLTTTNFGTNNPFLNMVCGGLNFQIEHHLFPYISHVHYKKVSEIVKKTAEEYGFPYFENPTFYEAVCSHVRLIKRLGRNESLV